MFSGYAIALFQGVIARFVGYGCRVVLPVCCHVAAWGGRGQERTGS